MFVCKIFFLLFVCSVKLIQAEEPASFVTVNIPMRDGATLAADLYYPPKSEFTMDEYPCILLRVPAGRKAFPWITFSEMAKKGYVVAIQDTRSAADPNGKTLPFLSDGWDVLQDGYDTVQWLAASHFTNGEIGTLGFSAAGITQMMLGPSNPPALKCQCIGQAFSSLYHHAIFPGGQLSKHMVETWLGLYARDFGVLSLIVSLPFYNEFWKKFDTVAVAGQVNVPGLHYVGWFDPFLQGAIDGFSARQKSGQVGSRGAQKLVIGPWTHYWPMDTRLGDFHIPKMGMDFPIPHLIKKWFDFYLKKSPNKVNDIPAVIYYVMGPFDGAPSSGNKWRFSNHWPVPSIATPLYLADHHRLTESLPKKEIVEIAYDSDPHMPVPTIGGRNLFLEQGPKDQRCIEDREDVMLFTTDILKEDIEVTGAIHVKLFFSSDVEDTDITIRLTDVYPDGRSVLIAEGISRISHLDPMASNREASIKEVEIDLWSTSLVFTKGHAIRILIAGSNYPRHEKNANIGFFGTNTGQSMVARHNVYMGEKTPSQLVLPIVRRGDQWLVEPQPEFNEGVAVQ